MIEKPNCSRCFHVVFNNYFLLIYQAHLNFPHVMWTGNRESIKNERIKICNRQTHQTPQVVAEINSYKETKEKKWTTSITKRTCFQGIEAQETSFFIFQI